MPVFSYKAIDNSGAVVKGAIEGRDMAFASASIESYGLYLINIRKSNEYLTALQRRLSGSKVKRTEIIEFANNLSLMLKAGMPILTALSDIADTLENKYFQQKVNNVGKLVEMGARFSDAVAEQGGIFPDIFVRIVVVGEETGSLDRSLSEVAAHLQRMEGLTAAIKKALIYPIFAIGTTLSALLFWLLYVLPKVMGVFKDMGVKIPLPTKILMVASDLTGKYWYIIPAVPAVFFLAVKVLKKKKETRYYIDLLKLKFPIMKLIVYNKLLTIFSEQLRILTVAGITIDRSFTILSEVIGNEVFKAAIEDSLQGIASGSRISDAMRGHAIFPAIMLRMIQIGETSGTLEEQFAYLSEYYLKRLDDISAKLEKTIEPVVMIVVGCIFAFIIIALLLPVYDLVSKMGA